MANINYTVPGLIVPVWQPSGMSCWAAMYTMMYSWKNQQSIEIRSAVSKLGQRYLDCYDNDTGLPIKENRNLSQSAGMEAEPLREAIEFAVTLLENVSVIIRGFWLWLEGETYLCKDLIKTFESSDAIRFRWSKNKQSWYFAAVPQSNKTGKVYSFEEIEAIYGRKEINNRTRRGKLVS